MVGSLVKCPFCNNIRKEEPCVEWLVSAQQVNPVHLFHLPTDRSEWAGILFVSFVEDKKQGSHELK